MMRAYDFINLASKRLSEKGIATARLDTLVLLEDCLEKDRAHLLAHPEIELSGEQQNILNAQIKRRLTHEPLAYIRGRTEFYGREFKVNKNVLEPRPESETMIDLLKNLQISSPFSIIDIGTGSGALAVTAKLELPSSAVIGIDIDPNCLLLAKQNAAHLQADVEYMQGDLLTPLKMRQSSNYVLLCNLPYVPENFHINTAATHEPSLAIFGGPDGLDPFRKLFSQAADFAKKPKYILTESLPPQHEKLALVAEDAGFTLESSEDFIQVFIPTSRKA